jgi:hypothetical protein
MDSTLSDSLSYLRSATASLHQDIESLMGAADGATFATVMGTGAKSTGRWTPAEMHEYIANDEELTAAGINMTDDERMGSDRAIRRLIYGYGDDIAGAVFEHTLNSWGTEMEEPIRDKINGLVVLVGKIDVIINDCVDKAKDLQKLDAKAVIGHRIVQEYDTNIEFVCETASKLNRYDVNIGKFTVAIDTLMYNSDVDGAKAQQDLRGSMIAERRFVESMLHSHFDGTSTSGKSAVKITLRDLKVPDALEKGKGVELIQNVNAFMKNRAPQYYAIMADIIRILAESKMGNYFMPATAANDYADVKAEIRDVYKTQAQSLYDEICMRVPPRIMNDIRVTFKYGIDEKPACCKVGDGPMAIFCLLALFRPAGLVYRDSLRTKLEEGALSFKGGSNPTAKIKELRGVILEAMDLGVKIAWRVTGKGIVTVMSERGNNFAQVLSKYSAVGGIADPEDSIVELNRMFTDIDDTIVAMEAGGIDVNRVMQVKVFTDPDKKKKTGVNEQKCWFGLDCTREQCTFTHDKEKKGKGGERKGKGGDRKGKGGDRKPKGGGGKGESKCTAKSCSAPARGWPLCNSCRREGIEKGSMTLKDGSTIPVTAHVKKPESTQKRLAQLEKRLTANQIDADDEDSEEDGEDLELFVGGMAPKSVQIAAARKKLKALEAAGTKRKRANTANVFDRLGTSEDDIPVKARKSTEAELNTELGMDTDSE